MALLPVYAELASPNRPEGMERIIAFTNHKGGVGKTTLCSNFAGQCGEAGYRVLVIDLNGQGNVGDDLGYRDRPGVDDQGEGLYEAIRRPDRNALQAYEVRPNVWVVPGGEELSALTTLVGQKVQNDGREANLALAATLAPIAKDYDIVVIDSPPENPTLLDLVLAAAHWVVMPTRSDSAGLRGMKLTARRFAAAREINPSIALLGVVLFGTLSNATMLHEEVRVKVAAEFGGLSPMLSTFIRYAERTAKDARDLGLLFHELEVTDPEARRQLITSLRATGNKKRRALSAATGSAARDFHDFTSEVLDIISAAEAAQLEEPNR